MNASIKTFFAAHKTTIIIASAALVIGSKAFSTIGHNNQEQMPQGYQNQGHQSQGYQQQSYAQQRPQQSRNNGGGYFDSWFGGNNQNENQGGYTDGGYQNQGAANYGGGNTGANYYNPTAGNNDVNDNYWKQEAAKDRQAEKFDDYIRDQAEYTDGYGNNYKMNSGYDYNYVNTNTNEAIQTNDAGYDPNVSASSSYTAVTPSDYSTPAATTTTTTTAGDE